MPTLPTLATCQSPTSTALLLCGKGMAGMPPGGRFGKAIAASFKSSLRDFAVELRVAGARGAEAQGWGTGTEPE